jgi:hypothetical protein
VLIVFSLHQESLKLFLVNDPLLEVVLSQTGGGSGLSSTSWRPSNRK